MKKNHTTFKNTHGLSLVELMVAMTVSAILMLGISEIFSINSRSYKVQDENARMQENGRFAFNTLMADIRRAGYFGGSAAVDEITGSVGIAIPARDCLTSDTTWGRMLERPVYGLNDANTQLDADGVTVNYTTCIPTLNTGSDILVTRYTKSASIAAPANNGRLYIRSSLFEGRLFTGTNYAANLSSNIVTTTPNAIRELAAHAYYVAPSGRNCRFDNADGTAIPVPALQREVLSSTGIPTQEEVASGIERFQVQYGVSNNGDLSVNRYFNAHQLRNNPAITPNWTQVLSVRFWVLVRADCPTSGYTNPQTYTMGDAPAFTPNDGFKRQLYSTTVAVRN